MWLENENYPHYQEPGEKQTQHKNRVAVGSPSTKSSPVVVIGAPVFVWVLQVVANGDHASGHQIIGKVGCAHCVFSREILARAVLECELNNGQVCEILIRIWLFDTCDRGLCFGPPIDTFSPL
jgi:hypothetical protein